MDFLAEHTFAFAPFPSQFYVSVRRNLPFFDYMRFIKKARNFFTTYKCGHKLTLQNFPACSYPLRPYANVPNGLSAYGAFEQPSEQLGLSQFNNGQLNYQFHGDFDVRRYSIEVNCR